MPVSLLPCRLPMLATTKIPLQLFSTFRFELVILRQIIITTQRHLRNFGLASLAEKALGNASVSFFSARVDAAKKSL